MNKIINICQNFNTAIEHLGKPTEDEKDSIEYFNLDLAKAIIQDVGESDVKQIVKVILGFIG